MQSTVTFTSATSPGATTYTDENSSFMMDDDDLMSDDVGDCSSFRDIEFESEEMKHLLKLESPPNKDKVVRPDYHAEHLFPQWILNNHEWQSTECRGKGNKISEILQTSYALRSQEQTSSLIHWLMSVWKTAFTMGFKRCAQMSKVFQFLVFEPGQDIIVEGEKGLTFYIIISGEAIVLKSGIGQVAVLHKGHSFGELALTEGNDKRSATIRALTKVEILQLHKVDYDHFVKDIQLVERRENLHVLRSCRLFENWPRTKVQKMCNFCSRVTYEPGSIIFNQGDKPDKIYFIIEGQVDIFKEVCVVVRNRWPTGMNSYDGMAKKKVRPFLAQSLHKDDYFGELVQDQVRKATAKAKTRCTLLTLDRLEFAHVINGGKALDELQSGSNEFSNDKRILDTMLQSLSFKGGPSTTAQLNDYVKVINANDKKKRRNHKERTVADTESSVCDETDIFSSDNCLSTQRSALSTSRSSFRDPNEKNDDIACRKKRVSRNAICRNGAKSNVAKDAAKNIDKTDAVAHGLTVIKNMPTEFQITSSPTASGTLKRSASQIVNAKKFEKQLSRTSSAVEEIIAERESTDEGKPPVKKGDSFSNLLEDVIEVKRKEKEKQRNMVEKQKKLQEKAAAVKKKPGEGRISILIEEIITANKRDKYHNTLARQMSTRPEVESKIAKVMPGNGSCLKFGRAVMKNYFTEANTTVYSHTKNLKKSNKNPTINVSDEANPVMTSINSVVVKTEKGRTHRSNHVFDINSYVASTQSKRSVGFSNSKYSSN